MGSRLTAVKAPFDYQVYCSWLQAILNSLNFIRITIREMTTSFFVPVFLSLRVSRPLLFIFLTSRAPDDNEVTRMTRVEGQNYVT
jgi:hypothetical protein